MYIHKYLNYKLTINVYIKKILVTKRFFDYLKCFNINYRGSYLFYQHRT